MLSDQQKIMLKEIKQALTPSAREVIETMENGIVHQEIRYQRFVEEAVSNIKIRDNTIARQAAKIKALESAQTARS